MKNKKKAEGNFIASWRYIKSIKNYIYFGIAVFVLFLILALVFPVPAGIYEAVMNALKDILEKTSGLNIWEMIFFIFKNNLLVSIMGIFLGVIFCIAPFVIALSNGYVIGFVVKLTIQKLGIISGTVSLWKLLPHGIFELPAVFISLGLGLRLGISLFSSLNKNHFKIFWTDLRNAVRVFVFVVLPLLIIAAIIEGVLIIFLK